MISVRAVTRAYGALKAVNDVSFELRPGEIVGFLGPNGAGKSTLLKMLCTYLPPTSGSIEVCGFDTVRDPLEVRRRIGYLPEHNALFDSMRVEAFLRFMGEARGLRGALLSERLALVAEKTQLEPVLKKRVRECSKGYRQRIGLAAALIHDPPVLLLDEPTHGLDPLQVVAFRDFIRELSAERTVLFSSHILAEVAQIAQRLLVLQHGQVCLDERVETLEARGLERDLSLEEQVIEAVTLAKEVPR
jgi:ABC-2 type transport system ATP-binding protein